MVAKSIDLWSLVRGQPQIDPNDLAAAVVSQAAQEPRDYRTRLLIRDSVDALRDYWGNQRFDHWLVACPTRGNIVGICHAPFEEVGFPSIRKRLMDKLDPETIRQYFQQLGFSLRQTVKIAVGGGCALILPGYITRFTEDIDVVGEVPEDIRAEYQLLDGLEKLHGLHLGHVQPHYFPRGWQERVHAFGVYHHLQVALVDVYDVFLSKLFSARMKDVGDLKVLAPQLDKEIIARRFRETCHDFLAAPRLKELAENNWKILFGEELPQ
ncbi:MAG: hypothetical protein HYX68_18860 [Planctomycetes bacterium]|jgi:hypothetical protein|nr:hypothetical protein [Planctomycetota bacterium]